MTIKKTILAVAIVLFMVSSILYVRSRSTAQGRPPLKAVTVEYRLYVEKPDGSIEEQGTKTYYQSANGAYSVIRRDTNGHVVNTIIGDKKLNAVFLVVGNEATKVQSDFGDTSATLPQEYKARKGYSGETKVFGESAYKQKTTQEDSGGSLETTSIAGIQAPVKTIQLEDDGSKTVEDVTAIYWGEPSRDKVTLSPSVNVTGAIDLLKARKEKH